MGLTIGPIAGVYLVDYALAPARYRTIAAVSLRVQPFVAWFFGIGVGLTTLPRDGGGLGLLQLTSAPMLDALFGGALAHWAMQTVLRGRSPQPVGSA